MSWSAPSSVSTGDLITASMWNQDIVDNFQFLYDERISVMRHRITDSGSYNYGQTSSTTFVTAYMELYYLGSEIDETNKSIYAIYAASVSNASAGGYCVLTSDGGNIGDSVTQITTVGTPPGYHVSLDVVDDAGWQAGDVTIGIKHKETTGSYNIKTYGFWLAIVG